MTHGPAGAAPAMLGLLVLSAACSHVGAGGTGPRAVASGTFHDAAGERVGLATLSDSGGTLRLGVSAAQLSPGLHGLHFHAQGSCSPPDFASAGPHFNPERREHGRLNPQGPHQGDLPNLLAGPEGSADTSFAVPSELAAPGPNSLLQSGGGTAIVIHAKPDDERTDPGGDSGERVACAVLEPG